MSVRQTEDARNEIRDAVRQQMAALDMTRDHLAGLANMEPVALDRFLSGETWCRTVDLRQLSVSLEWQFHYLEETYAAAVKRREDAEWGAAIESLLAPDLTPVLTAKMLASLSVAEVQEVEGAVRDAALRRANEIIARRIR